MGCWHSRSSSINSSSLKTNQIEDQKPLQINGVNFYSDPKFINLRSKALTSISDQEALDYLVHTYPAINCVREFYNNRAVLQETRQKMYVQRLHKNHTHDRKILQCYLCM